MNDDLANRGPCLPPDPSARAPVGLLVIVLLALGIRLWGAWRANLIFDERAHWALAETIDLRPGHLHLVSRTLDHPLLSIYLLRFGSWLLGTSDFALRLPYVLIGSAAAVPVYFLARRVFSPRAGLLAAALLAVDLFHAGWSRVFMPEVLMLSLASLAMLQFLRALEVPSIGRFAGLGALAGLAYLAKEPAALLLPAFWLHVVATPARRGALRSAGWYWMHAVFAAVVAPDLLWNLCQWTDSYLYRDLSLASQSPGLSLKPVSLYLGEIIRAAVDRGALGEDYLEGNLYACHAVAGVVYLGSVCAMTRAALNPDGKGLLAVFFAVFVFFLVLPGGEFYEPFWWASLSLVPAVVYAGGLLDRWISRAERACGLRVAMVFLLVAGLGVATVAALSHRGNAEPRHSVSDFADDFLTKGRAALDRGDLREAEGRFIYVLNIAGPRADAYYGLAQAAFAGQRNSKAARLVEKCLARDPGHAGALDLKRRLAEHR